MMAAASSGAVEMEELREHAWNPLLANPGRPCTCCSPGTSRRCRTGCGRWPAGWRGPGVLAAARAHSGRCRGCTWRPRSASSTGRSSWSATPAPMAPGAGAAVADIDGCGPPRWRRWPGTGTGYRRGWPRTPDGAGMFADPRLGPDRFARKLSLTLQAQADADAILARAESDLDRITEQITELRPGLGGRQGRCSTGSARTHPTEHHPAYCERRCRADRVRTRAGPRHCLRGPGRGDRHAGDRPRRGGRLLRPARAAGARRCQHSSPSRRRRPTGAPSGSPRSTASTTATWCAT